MKKLFSLVLIAASINAYADNIKVIRVLTEHVHSAPVNHVKNNNGTLSCNAVANPASGLSGHYVTATGNITYSILDNTFPSETYYVDEWMCIGSECTHTKDKVYLNYGESKSSNKNVSVSEYFYSPATYVDQATIQITGVTTCWSQSTNTVVVN